MTGQRDNQSSEKYGADTEQNVFFGVAGSEWLLRSAEGVDHGKRDWHRGVAHAASPMYYGEVQG
jgi:hypothetical protein